MIKFNNETGIFNFNGIELRVIMKDDEPWFVLNEVCEAVGGIAPRVVKQRLSDEVCSTYPIPDALGRLQEKTIISEDGLYDVIFESRKPQAKEFRKWVTSDVLPEIRKNGMYISEDATHEQVKFNITNFMSNIDDYNITKLYDLIEQFLSYHREKKTRLPYERKNIKRHGNKKLKDHIDSMEDIRDQLVSYLNVKIDTYNNSNQAGLAQEYVRIRGMVEWKVENMRYRSAACK